MKKINFDLQNKVSQRIASNSSDEWSNVVKKTGGYGVKKKPVAPLDIFLEVR